MSTNNELILLPQLPEKDAALAVYKNPEGLAPFVEHVRNAVAGLVPDTTTAKGRAEIKSLAFAVTRSKTALDNLGKELVDELKAIPKLIDAHRKVMRDDLDKLAEQVRKPLTDWEQAEADRKRKEAEAKEKLEAAIQKIVTAGQVAWGTPVATLQDRISKLEGIPTTPEAWGSAAYAKQAGAARDTALVSLRNMLVDRQAFEQQQQAMQLAPAATEPAAAAAIPQPAATIQSVPVPPSPPVRQMTQAPAPSAPEASQPTPAEQAAAALQEIAGISHEQAIAVVNAIARGEIPYLCIESSY